MANSYIKNKIPLGKLLKRTWKYIRKEKVAFIIYSKAITIGSSLVLLISNIYKVLLEMFMFHFFNLPPQAYFLAVVFPPFPNDLFGFLEAPAFGVILPLLLCAIINTSYKLQGKDTNNN